MWDEARRRVPAADRAGGRQWRQRRAPQRSRRAPPRVARAPRAMGTPPPPPPAAKQTKSRRKISLPWFRQSSVSAPHAALSRQHTIDTPGSFHARLLNTNRQRQVNARRPALHFAVVHAAHCTTLHAADNSRIAESSPARYTRNYIQISLHLCQ